MKKVFALTVLLLLFGSQVLRADEGMWLPSLISQRIGDMQSKGFKLSAEDIYSINKASLKDAVMLFGSGCTGELVSDQGLLFTNHHCGYGYIQRHSSVEHDYLKDGFWAMNRNEELPNKGLSVSFLEYMQDVTDRVLVGYNDSMSEKQRDSIVKVNSQKIVAQAVAKGKGLSANVEPLYYGNQYFLFVFKVFRDVRLVAAPPSSIGKFGGDTDNWMWPRHTGDFSIFRIYADKNNNPAEYSEDNVPYRPKKFFKISMAGVKEGDFTFVYGCPGSTKEYVTSDEVSYTANVSDPAKIALRTQRLNIQKKYMNADQAVRIQYSSKNANVANAWKKWQGEEKGIKKMGTVNSKKEYEKRFKEWAKSNKYDGILEKLESLYSQRNPYFFAYEYYTETIRTIEILQFASNIYGSLKNKNQLKNIAENFYKDYYQPIDEEIFVAMVNSFNSDLDDSFKPQYIKDKIDEFGSVEGWKNYLFANTIFTDKAKVLSLTSKDGDKIKSDPAYEMYQKFYQWYFNDIRPTLNNLNSEIRVAYRAYMQGQMDFEKNRQFYPDANLTLRVAYGNIKGYSPSDAVYYKPQSTLKGIIEKDNPDIFDYNIPQKLRDIYAKGGHEDQPVCFIATNHTTGGNSGSPVLDAYGNLIGINFDRVWEGTMSDIAFDPEFCRNISLDVRYIIFNIEHIGEAGYLLKEMEFVK